MDRVSALLLALLAGCLSVVQTGINTQLSEKGIGAAGKPLPALVAALINFSVGLAVIVVVALIHKTDMSDVFFCNGSPPPPPALRDALRGPEAKAQSGDSHRPDAPPGPPSEAPSGETAAGQPHPPTKSRAELIRSYLGGPCGAFYVTCSVVFTPRIGVALYFVILVAGTMCMSLAMDRMGWLGLKQQSITKRKAAALALLLAGAVMVQEPGSSDDDGGSDIGTAERILISVGTFVAGFANPVQAALNRSMQDIVGTPFRATVVSFAGGVLFLAVVCSVAMLVTGEEPDIYPDADPYVWFGGFLGVAFVTSAVIAVPALGAATYYCALVAAQLSTAFVFDSTGSLGYTQKDVTPLRVIGTVTALGAVVLFTWPLVQAPPPPAAGHGESEAQAGGASGPETEEQGEVSPSMSGSGSEERMLKSCGGGSAEPAGGQQAPVPEVPPVEMQPVDATRPGVV